MKILVDKLPESPIECAFNDVHYDLDAQSGYQIPHFMCKLTANYKEHPCELTRDEKRCPYLIEANIQADIV